MILRFEHYEIDTDRRELRGAGRAVHVEPQVFDLLLFLVQNRGRVVTKDELYEHVWKGRIVSEATLSSRINAARRAVGDTGEKQVRIRTVPRRGFRFVAEILTGPNEVAPAVAAQADSAGDPAQKVTFCKTPEGINIAVGTVGNGPILVKAANWINHLEHDWRSPLFQPLFQRLARRHQLVRYDGRGIGLSDWNIEAVAFEDLVSDLETVADAQRLQRFSLLGISQGVAVAIAYAAKHPERVEKLVLHGGYAQGRRRRDSQADEEQAEAFTTLMRYGWGDEHSAFMQAFSSVYLPKGTAEQVRWYSDLQRVSTSAENAVRLRIACDLIDVTRLLPKISVPTLVTHSRHDQVAPFDQGRLIAASIPEARLVTLDSANHVVLPDEPAWATWMSEIEVFLTS